jgi:hypothetical protein
LKIGVRGYRSFSEELEARGKSDRFSYCFSYGRVEFEEDGALAKRDEVVRSNQRL